MNNKILEFFGYRANCLTEDFAKELLFNQICPYSKKKCYKTRKSQPDISIGTCIVQCGEGGVIICPYRLLQRGQVFVDCMHLLHLHEPGNELHIVSEVAIPGGNIDYFLISARNRKVKDFIAIEFQTMDTTGTVWPERQRLIHSWGVPVSDADINSIRPFGMNWKMTAKTILVQLHHKIQTFEHLNKHLVLVIQDCLLHYMQREFSFSHLAEPARSGDSMHIHSYQLNSIEASYALSLNHRLSTDSIGIANCLGLQAEAKVDLDRMILDLEHRISDATLFVPFQI